MGFSLAQARSRTKGSGVAFTAHINRILFQVNRLANEITVADGPDPFPSTETTRMYNHQAITRGLAGSPFNHTRWELPMDFFGEMKICSNTSATANHT